MEVRAFELADYDAVARLWQRAGLPPSPGDDLPAVRHKLSRDADLFVVAEDGGAIVGAAMGAYDGRRGTVYRMAVDPECRRRGVGSALLAEVEARLRARGCSRVHLLVQAGNRPALAFYASRGYGRSAYVVVSKGLGPAPSDLPIQGG